MHEFLKNNAIMTAYTDLISGSNPESKELEAAFLGVLRRAYELENKLYHSKEAIEAEKKLDVLK